MRPQRKYEPVWNRLKLNGSIVLQVHRLIAARVVKAVIKEKNQDVSFKMANDKDKLYLAIGRIALSDGKHVRLELRLKQRFGLVDVEQEIDLGLEKAEKIT